MSKQCKRCLETKNIDEFYKHKQMADGHLNYCKECTKKRVKKYAHSKHGRKVEQEWWKTPTGRAKQKRLGKRYRKNYPEKRIAHYTAGNGIRDNKLERKPCEKCGTWENVEMHHDDYSKPLDVTWLCFKHHRQLHGQLIDLSPSERQM